MKINDKFISKAILNGQTIFESNSEYYALFDGNYSGFFFPDINCGQNSRHDCIIECAPSKYFTSMKLLGASAAYPARNSFYISNDFLRVDPHNTTGVGLIDYGPYKGDEWHSLRFSESADNTVAGWIDGTWGSTQPIVNAQYNFNLFGGYIGEGENPFAGKFKRLTFYTLGVLRVDVVVKKDGFWDNVSQAYLNTHGDGITIKRL